MNEVVPPQDPQNPQVPIEKGVMSNVKRRDSIHSLTQVLATLDARYTRVQINSNASTFASRIRDFTRMNPLFFGLKWRRNCKGSLMKFSKC